MPEKSQNRAHLPCVPLMTVLKRILNLDADEPST